MFLSGEYAKAVSESDRLIASRASNIDNVYYLKGLALLKSARYKEARENFEKVITKFQRTKRGFDARLGIGDSYLLGGDAGAAIKIYEEMLGRYRDDKNVSLVYHRLGNCYKRLGSNAKAAEYFDKLKSASPLSFEAKTPSALEIKSGVILKDERQSPSGGYFSIQAGYFKDRANAERLSRKLSGKNYDTFVEKAIDAGQAYYRVKAGRYGSKDEAKKAAAALKKLGYSTKICYDDIYQ